MLTDDGAGVASFLAYVNTEFGADAARSAKALIDQHALSTGSFVPELVLNAALKASGHPQLKAVADMLGSPFCGG